MLKYKAKEFIKTLFGNAILLSIYDPVYKAPQRTLFIKNSKKDSNKTYDISNRTY
tara:strand:- start:97 stop:261 length:165 start_codon:yes stop_codon:yes gene_type:complete